MPVYSGTIPGEMKLRTEEYPVGTYEYCCFVFFAFNLTPDTDLVVRENASKSSFIHDGNMAFL